MIGQSKASTHLLTPENSTKSFIMVVLTSSEWSYARRPQYGRYRNLMISHLRDTIDLAATYTIGSVVKVMARRNGSLPMQARFAMRTC